MKSAVISQVTVFLAAANPSPLHSESLQSVLTVCVIIPLDLRVISVSDGRLSFPPCHYIAHKCQFLSKRALTLPRPALSGNTTLLLPATCGLPPYCGI